MTAAANRNWFLAIDLARFYAISLVFTAAASKSSDW
jgi:hypothetical protein